MAGIREKGIEIVIVHPKPKAEDEVLVSELKDLGCTCVQLDVAVSYNKFGKNVLKYILRPVKIYWRKNIFYRQLRSIVLQERPDIIHTNTGVVHEGFLVAKKLNIPHVWHLREYQTKDFHMTIVPSLKRFKSMLKNSYTVCITKDIQDYFGLSNNRRATVIYNPAMSENAILKHESVNGYFLIANRISSEKGITDILEAFAEFTKKHGSFLLKIAGFGEEEYVNKMKEVCRRFGIFEKVEFLGFVSDVRALMQKARALIVGSYNEGFGRMTAEANMLGIPVIGRNSGGTKEILELTGGGILFNTTEEMKDAMMTIVAMSDEQNRNFMKRPQEKAIKLFSSEQHIRNVLELYTDIFGMFYHTKAGLGGGK
ncbi:MAG: glycosyltransferase family 4 protein [Treponema sp.]|nr:glycosyltransferase family 4 protein [Treponema sp.]